MTDLVAKAEELIRLTGQLASIMEADVALLRGRRPAELASNENDRTMTMLLYTKAATELKGSNVLKQLPGPVRTRLRAASERLQAAVKEQNRLLTRFRHVTEGMIKAVADVEIGRAHV